MPAPEILTPLRKLTAPGALARECAVCRRLGENLLREGERHWTDLQLAQGRLRTAQIEVEERLDAIRKNLGEREALLDRYEALLDARELEL